MKFCIALFAFTSVLFLGPNLPSFGQVIDRDIDSLPIHQLIPDNIRNISVKLTRRSKERFKGKRLFEAETKEVLGAIKNSGSQLIEVEDTVFKFLLTGTMSGTEDSTNVGSFIDFMDFDNDLFAGRSVHYYMEGGKLYICSPMTAQKRVVNRWKRLTPEQKGLYNKNKQRLAGFSLVKLFYLS